MNYKLIDLIDIPKLLMLLNALEEIQKIPSAILDTDGNILTATAWQDVCTQFHRANPKIEKQCQISDRYIETRLNEQELPVIYRCPMGLVDAAKPIIIEGHHLGNVFVGQLFTEPQNEDFFASQAHHYGFDVNDYLAAVRNVPIIPEEKLRRDLDFIHELAKMLAEQGLHFRRLQETEKSLRDAEWKFKALFENGPIGVAYHRMVYDETGKAIDYFFLDANEKYQELTGVDPRGKTVRDAFPGIEHDPFNWIETFGRVAKDGETIRFEQYLQTNDRWYDCVAYQYQPDHFVAAFQEITERKKAEEQLRTEQFRLEEIIRGTKVGTWEWNIQTGAVVVNQRWTEIIGYTLDELTPVTIETWRDHIHPKDLEKSNILLRKHFSGESDFFELEYRMKHKDGHWLWVLDRGKASSWTEENQPLLMYGTHSDIDERKRLEEEQHRIAKLESVGLLAGGIAHDFNNILAGLFGNLSLAKRKLSTSHPSSKFLDGAERSIKRATLLTNQLLTFAKGGAPIKEPISLEELVSEVVNFNLSGSNVKLKIKTKGSLWFVNADQGQIQQVFGNLAINAKQAMPNGGQLHIALENVALSDNETANLSPGKYLRIVLTDEGEGIEPDKLEHIFEPYFTTKQGGSGLGLATAYSIIKNHNGHIGVISQPGQGATFTIHLPASEESREIPGSDENNHKIRPVSAHILILDDDSDILSSLSAMLEELGCSYKSVKSGEQAIELYQGALSSDNPFHLVILDLTIQGGIGGKEVAKKLLEVNPNEKLIVSSGYADDQIMANYADYGFSGVLTKPYNLEKLSSVLSTVLN